MATGTGGQTVPTSVGSGAPVHLWKFALVCSQDVAEEAWLIVALHQNPVAEVQSTLEIILL